MKLLLGDCLEKLKELDDNSIDSIVTDPPYGLSFMGKEWDKKKATQETKSQVVKGLGAGMKMTTLADNIEFEKWVTEWSMECMRVLKPGGYMLAFGGSRMYHRLASGVENAGFEVRDQLMWIYGSGFPKSLNIGKGVDKRKEWDKYEVFSNSLKSKREELGLSKKQAFDKCGFEAPTFGGNSWYEDGRIPSRKDYELLKSGLELGDDFDGLFEEVEREFISNESNWGKEGITSLPTSGQWTKTKGNSEWEGWGTALKPAHEPIVMARKPLSEKTVVENVLEWGTGGINIEDSRIGTESIPQKRHIGSTFSQVYKEKNQSYENLEWEYQVGRFPANVIFDEEAGKILDEQSGILKSGNLNAGHKRGVGTGNSYANGGGGGIIDRNYGGDEGGASRFFYCPKTSKTDRNEGLEDFEDKEGLRTTGKGLSNVIRKCPTHGKSIPSGYSTYECGCKFEFSDDQTVKSTKNIHPTVKPTDLMLYLIRLITPKGGTTLDPFMGSGSTGKAAVRGGFDFVGVEMDEEYMEIATARIQYEQDNPYNEEKGERVEVNKNSNKFW